jgi:hypothetical protein
VCYGCEAELKFSQVGGLRIDLGGRARLQIGIGTLRKTGLCYKTETVMTTILNLLSQNLTKLSNVMVFVKKYLKKIYFILDIF